MVSSDAYPELVATALLRGRWDVDGLSARMLAMGVENHPLARRLAHKLVVWFGARGRPRVRDLARLLGGSPAFRACFEGLSLNFEDLPRPERAPAAGAPAEWRLPEFRTFDDLAAWLGLDGDELRALRVSGRRGALEWMTHREHYHQVWVPRRGRVPRLIEAPKTRLKAVQVRIHRGLLAMIPPHAAAHGFVPGRSRRSFVAPHVGRACVVRIDIEDFFASLGRGRVLRLFVTAGYDEDLAAGLADLCTTTTPGYALEDGLGAARHAPRGARLVERLRRRHLPQGAPTSPALANLCAFALDARLTGLARRFEAVYTRYADDLVFSGGAAFARDAERLAERVGAVLLECGLRTAHHKTRVMRRGVRQQAGGLVLNDQAAVPRAEREQLEAILVNCVRRGPEGQNRSGIAEFRAHLLGRIVEIGQMQPRHGARLRAWFDRIVW